ncbi:MAG TPA: PRC-barrel domain containing protein [Acidimicrobiia bacterium]|nr:PRC-barrel domain containing protein [Acidimicrobiia bacterium]
MDIYAFRAEVYVPAMPDLTGFDVEATDGHVGKIDEATMTEGATCLIVDTGFWIFGHKRMLPAGVVRAIDVEERKVLVDMSKDEIKAAPDCDDEHHKRDEPEYHDQVGRYYDPWGGTPPMEGA